MLPKTEARYYDFEVNGKTVEFRAWKTRDEKEFLIIQESGNKLTDNDIFDVLVKPCLKNKDIQLTDGEKQLVMLEIRKKSFGDSLEVRYECGECGKYNEGKINIDKIVHYKPFSLKPVTKDGITLTFKDTINNNLLKGLEASDLNYMKFVLHVSSIAKDQQVYKDFTVDEAKEFFDELEAETFDFFFAELQEQVETVDFSSEVKCMFCGEKQEIGLGNLPNLFPW
jgi:hypothetical protein